jgi:hypothetical protein
VWILIRLPHSPGIKIISSQNGRRSKVHHLFCTNVIIVERRAIKQVTVENLLSSVEIVEINIAVVSTTEAVTVEIFMVNISIEVTRVEINIKKDG